MSGRIDLDAIRRRVEAATPGPWWPWDRGVGWHIALGDPAVDADDHGRPLRELPEGFRTDIGRGEDAQFIAHARQDIPALLDEIDRLREDADDYRETIFVLTELLERVEKLTLYSDLGDRSDDDTVRIGDLRRAINGDTERITSPYESLAAE